MTSIVPNASARILSTALHHLDMDTETCAAISMPVERQDLELYLNELLTEINGRPQNRAYALASATTEFATSLQSFFGNQDLALNPQTKVLAERLLRVELTTEERYGHLNASGAGHIKKGSFLQFLYRDGTDVTYLGVKVEHQKFLDETDLRTKIGLGDSNKIYKACKVSYDGAGNTNNALVFDTNSRPSTYWWKDVLELKQLRTDAFNTEQAVKSVMRVIAKVKTISPADYTILRNATVHAFKQVGTLNFDDFVAETFTKYTSIEAALDVELPNIVVKLKELPSKRNFDGQFTLVPASVPYRRHTIVVSDEVSVSYNEDIANLSDKIWSSRTPDGQSVVIIDAPGSADKFTPKPWNTV